MKIESALYLLPVNISESPISDTIPAGNVEIIRQIKYYIVENIRTARRFLKKCDSNIDISELTFYELNEHTQEINVSSYLNVLREGQPIGLMSEAGCPGVADPGAIAVRIAHMEGLKVVPLVGPSSILMSLMASGLNGQNFTFNGYLPADKGEREKKIKELENISRHDNLTQIFIETPYRNVNMMESLIKTLSNDTWLCVSTAVSDPKKESIVTRRIAEWRKEGYNIDKVPTVFLFYSPALHKKRR